MLLLYTFNAIIGSLKRTGYVGFWHRLLCVEFYLAVTPFHVCLMSNMSSYTLILHRTPSHSTVHPHTPTHTLKNNYTYDFSKIQLNSITTSIKGYAALELHLVKELKWAVMQAYEKSKIFSSTRFLDYNQRAWKKLW